MVINSEDLLEASPIVGMYHRKVKSNGVSHGLSEAGYDIRIKQDVTFTVQEQTQRCIAEVMNENSMIDMSFGRFALASTIEEFNMPSDLVGIVHDKSTWARKGLSVFNTVIEPGWKGFLTLELVYHGGGKLVIPAGSGIAQVIFHKLSLHREYNGKYQNQGDNPVPAKHE